MNISYNALLSSEIADHNLNISEHHDITINIRPMH
jgi:hypothetical protein